MTVRLTTEQMKAELAKLKPAPAIVAQATPQPKDEVIVADVLSGGVANAIHSVEMAGSNVAGFIDRFKTSYRYTRAVQTGKLPAPKEEAAPAVTRSRRGKAS